MNRPASIPTTSSERLAASIMASEARNAAGPPQNPMTASSSDIGTTTQASARRSPRVVRPEAESTAISLSRYRRP